jgi:hypothetical protein
MTKKEYRQHMIELLVKMEKEQRYEDMEAVIMYHKKNKYNCSCKEIDCSKNYIRN